MQGKLGKLEKLGKLDKLGKLGKLEMQWDGTFSLAVHDLAAIKVAAVNY
jgi:hypothetical protein